VLLHVLLHLLSLPWDQLWGGVYCGGYPTCKHATNLPYFKNPL
jgi:hypothetical protein